MRWLARPAPEVAVSALTGAGIDVLKQHILRAVGRHDEAGVFSARRRHLDALNRAHAILERGVEALRIDAAQANCWPTTCVVPTTQLGEIVGSVSSDALLGEIFARFCIGK